jgi:hypothetical protein
MVVLRHVLFALLKTNVFKANVQIKVEVLLVHVSNETQIQSQQEPPAIFPSIVTATTSEDTHLATPLD